MVLETVLGELAPSAEELGSTVAALLGCAAEGLELGALRAAEVPYDQEAITTLARFRVQGTARWAGRAQRWSMFVKVVQPWHRSPAFAAVPSDLRSVAARGVPWATEGLVYGSDLADRLPPGLSLPRAARVELASDRNILWLQDVSPAAVAWDDARYTRAAYLLGRLAGSARVRPLGAIGETERRLGPVDYAEGRLRHQVRPALEDDGLWEHPLMAPFEPELRDRMRWTARHARRIAEELDALPRGTAHGDACPNNLLVVDPAGDDVVMIDFAFWSTQALGFDLGQLQLGEAQLGRRDVAEVAAVDDALVDSYVDGLRAESCAATTEQVRRAHALQTVLYSGLSAIPIDLFDQPPAPRLTSVARTRAGLARLTLDLLERTGGL